VYAGPDGGALPEAWRLINQILSGREHLEPARFERVCSAFHAQRVALRFDLREESDGIAGLISGLVRRYGERAYLAPGNHWTAYRASCRTLHRA
jgi:hypothetical protein